MEVVATALGDKSLSSVAPRLVWVPEKLFEIPSGMFAMKHTMGLVLTSEWEPAPCSGQEIGLMSAC